MTTSNSTSKTSQKVGKVRASTVNIAGRDVKQTIEPTQAAEARERRELQERYLAGAAQAYADEQDRLGELLANPPRPPAPYKGLHYFDPTD
jgi:hypothetical protein